MTDGLLFVGLLQDLTDPLIQPMMQALATIQSVQGFRIRPDAASEPRDLFSDVAIKSLGHTATAQKHDKTCKNSLIFS